MKVFVYPWLLLASVFFSPGKVYADCSGGSGIISTVAVSIPQHISRDEIYRSLDSQSRANMAITCTNMPVGATHITVGIKAYGDDSGITSIYRKIFKLGDSGIGYVVIGVDDTHDEKPITTTADRFWGGNARELYTTEIGPDGTINLNAALRLEFYKIGPIKPGRYSQSVAAAIVAPRGSRIPSVIQEFRFTTGMITINAPTCSVDNSTIPVTLGRITTMQLPYVGSTAAETLFNIPLTCEPKASVFMTLEAGRQGAYDLMQGIIELKRGLNERARDGVGVQILDGKTNMPIHLGEKKYYTTTGTGGPVNIPLKARYYRYGDVRAGVANATATFTMSYE
ncbi:fimbrial protein [Xenorhabdus bovienii]|uniref:fimbrial protein n=1 Tax=Xenorhabdus bovienii TaxID=40576 RepID=UPI003DA31314